MHDRMFRAARSLAQRCLHASCRLELVARLQLHLLGGVRFALDLRALERFHALREGLDRSVVARCVAIRQLARGRGRIDRTATEREPNELFGQPIELGDDLARRARVDEDLTLARANSRAAWASLVVASGPSIRRTVIPRTRSRRARSMSPSPSWR
jgi:hypothetical protein